MTLSLKTSANDVQAVLAPFVAACWESSNALYDCMLAYDLVSVKDGRYDIKEIENTSVSQPHFIRLITDCFDCISIFTDKKDLLSDLYGLMFAIHEKYICHPPEGEDLPRAFSDGVLYVDNSWHAMTTVRRGHKVGEFLRVVTGFSPTGKISAYVLDLASDAGKKASVETISEVVSDAIWYFHSIVPMVMTNDWTFNDENLERRFKSAYHAARAIGDFLKEAG